MAEASPNVNEQRRILRIIHVTDVYTLANFPSLKNLIAAKRAELESTEYATSCKTISVLTGDFLMPYVLSAVDKGKGMMKMLNHTPIDYLTWGNHEADLCHEDLMAREAEYQGIWVNTNMQSHESFAKSTCQTDVAWIKLGEQEVGDPVWIALIGILTPAGPPGAFNGAKIENPWDVMREYKQKLENEGADLVIPLCHLYEHDDDFTAKEFNFPLILGGHDHHVVNKVVNGTRILKPGLDAERAHVIDLIWEGGSHSLRSGGPPKLMVEILRVADFEPDAALAAEAEQAYSVLANLRESVLCEIPPRFREWGRRGAALGTRIPYEFCCPKVDGEGVPSLSSCNARQQWTTMGSYLCSELRDALNTHGVWASSGKIIHKDDAVSEDDDCTRPVVDCVIMKAGVAPRGERGYGPDEHMTLEMLQSEMKEGRAALHVYRIPGRVLRKGIGDRWTPEKPNPEWFHFDDGVEVDWEKKEAVIVGNKLIQDNKMYRVGCAADPDSHALGSGTTFKDFVAEHGDEMVEDPDATLPAQTVLMRYWAEQLWERIYAKIDVDQSGNLSEAELLAFKRRMGLCQENDVKEECACLSRRELRIIKRNFGLSVYMKGEENTFIDVLLQAAGRDWGLKGTAVLGVEDLNREWRRKRLRRAASGLQS